MFPILLCDSLSSLASGASRTRQRGLNGSRARSTLTCGSTRYVNIDVFRPRFIEESLFNTVLDEAAAPITLIQNWNPEAKK